VPSTRLAFTGRSGRRVVEGGTVELWVGTPERRLTVATMTHEALGEEALGEGELSR
jgi:hypothetical protein